MSGVAELLLIRKQMVVPRKFAIMALAVCSVQSVRITREPLLTWKASEPKHIPRDYFVPNFGADDDVKTTFNSVKIAEKNLSHVWTPPDDSDHPVNYFVPHFGEDQEIKEAKESIATLEK